MRHRMMWLLALTAVIGGCGLYNAGDAMATTANKFISSEIADGTFGEIDVFNQFIPTNLSGEQAEGNKGSVWLS